MIRTCIPAVNCNPWLQVMYTLPRRRLVRILVPYVIHGGAGAPRDPPVTMPNLPSQGGAVIVVTAQFVGRGERDRVLNHNKRILAVQRLHYSNIRSESIMVEVGCYMHSMFSPINVRTPPSARYIEQDNGFTIIQFVRLYFLKPFDCVGNMQLDSSPGPRGSLHGDMNHRWLISYNQHHQSNMACRIS